jgi:2-polyprenyl-3-methyl-5-hydroxy-6-metoxy-1,4-benzoquinol methylase
METIEQCHLCKATAFKVLFEQQDLFLESGQTFTVQQCQSCKLVSLNPRPGAGELMTFYPDTYVAYTRPLQDEVNAIAKKDRGYGLYKRIKFIEKYIQGGRILDVGCATGSFLEACGQYWQKQPSQWQLYGIEPNEHAAQIAQKASRADIQIGMLEAAHYPDHFFDVVTLWDVLEHVYEPRDTLVEIRRILKPQGVLVFSLPNLDSWDAAIFGKYWVGYDVPRHMHVFSQKTLNMLLSQAHFKQIGKANVAGSHFYFFTCILFYLRATRPDHWFSAFVERIHTNILLRLLVAPYFFLSDHFVKSTTVTYVCRPHG